MKKTLDYIFGFITGSCVTITLLVVFGFSSADNGIIKIQIVNSRTNPLFVEEK